MAGKLPQILDFTITHNLLINHQLRNLKNSSRLHCKILIHFGFGLIDIFSLLHVVHQLKAYKLHCNT